MDGSLLNPSQSGIYPDDSCFNQLLAITHEVFEAFGCNSSLKVRCVFLDLSKAFKIFYITLNLWVSLGNFMIFLKTTYFADFEGLF